MSTGSKITEPVRNRGGEMSNPEAAMVSEHSPLWERVYFLITRKNNQQKELYLESHPVDLRIRVRSVWMWEREHIPHVVEVWEPRRSIRGSKRRQQCTRMTLEDVDTAITSPKSINSIPEDYFTFLFIKCSVLDGSLLGPFVSPIWGGFLITQQR